MDLRTRTDVLDTLFNEARTHHHWLEKPVNDDLLKQIYDLAKMGPTSANCNPMRLIFVKTKEAKERLSMALDKGNIPQTMAAPVTAIVAYDMAFYKDMPRLFAHNPTAKSWFEGKPDFIKETAFRNGSLQGGYFILAARACRLDCGPMSGFDNKKVDELFFSGTSYQSNFLCNLGYGDSTKIHPRDYRYEFNETCKIV